MQARSRATVLCTISRGMELRCYNWLHHLYSDDKI